ncbi:MAG: 2-phosphosulfolactate phosphatase, partial [Gemmatimonadaceae bacterium]
SLSPTPVAADVAVVVDVLRFTSSAAYALANGARSVVPCATLDEARAQAGQALVAGERHGTRPDGFDLGNSPLEFTRQAVQGRDIAWTTTNGTAAIETVLNTHAPSPLTHLSPPHSSQPPAPLPLPLLPRDVSLASYVNLSAVAAFLAPLLEACSAVAIACSGRDGGFALEDSACAGALVRRLQARLGDALTVDDGARACACIDEAYGEDIARLFRDAQHGRFLGNHGFGADLLACAALDAVQVVPRWRDGRFVAG